MELDETTIAELQRLMDNGEQTSASITQLYLDQIATLDRQGPRLGSIIETNPDALDIAKALDDERRQAGPRGPLHGVPIVLKDNIDTHDGMTTTAGSLALEGSIAPRDSFVASQLRNAGAVLLAKANMSEWAYFRGTKATSGWSARGGQCRNPYDLDRNPCGSSSGSAVAVAANLTAAAIGTETNGSILCPSSVNGIVGLKPTVGLWSQSGIIPISHSQDTAGPMTRTVADTAALLDAVTGADTRDPASDYSSVLATNGLVGARIGVARSFEGFDASTLERFDEALVAMANAGATLVDSVPVETATWVDNEPLVVLEYEFKAGLNSYLAGLGSGAPVRSLADVIDFNEHHAATELVHFGQQRLIAAQDRGSLDDAEYLEAKHSVQQRHRQNLDAILSGELAGADSAGPLDAIVMPSRGPAWLTDHVNGDPKGGGSTAGPAAIAGYPNLTVPMGFVDGLPVGVSFVGRPWSEGRLLRLGYAYEQVTRHRRPPMHTRTSR